MNQERSNLPYGNDSTARVFVLMSENDGGVAGFVCATRQRAEDELREALAEYRVHDADDAVKSFSFEVIESFVEEMRHTSINPYGDDWYWIDECSVQC